jgi:hypothetical protein
MASEINTALSSRSGCLKIPIGEIEGWEGALIFKWANEAWKLVSKLIPITPVADDGFSTAYPGLEGDKDLASIFCLNHNREDMKYLILEKNFSFP